MWPSEVMTTATRIWPNLPRNFHIIIHLVHSNINDNFNLILRAIIWKNKSDKNPHAKILEKPVCGHQHPELFSRFSEKIPF